MIIYENLETIQFLETKGFFFFSVKVHSQKK